MITGLNEELLLLQSWLQYKYGQISNSVILLQALLVLNPDNIQARKILIIALIESKQGKEALLQSSILRNNGYNNHYLYLCDSLAFELEGLEDEAQDSFRKYLMEN